MAKAKTHAPDTIRVAYHEGPPEIGFCNINWKRGEVQPITLTVWTAMHMRADFKQFNFTEEK